jgi:hypothetical protein
MVHALSEFGGSLQLRFLVVRVDRLEHLRKIVAKSRGADLEILIRIEVVINSSGLEVTTLGNGFFSLQKSAGMLKQLNEWVAE